MATFDLDPQDRALPKPCLRLRSRQGRKGEALADCSLDLGDGNVEVFQSNNPAPITTLQTGKNPIAIAIQPK